MSEKELDYIAENAKLQKNPFLNEEEIADYVEKSLCDHLEREERREIRKEHCCL